MSPVSRAGPDHVNSHFDNYIRVFYEKVKTRDVAKTQLIKAFLYINVVCCVGRVEIEIEI